MYSYASGNIWMVKDDQKVGLINVTHSSCFVKAFKKNNKGQKNFDTTRAKPYRCRTKEYHGTICRYDH
jgi:hypothetical protein